MTDASAPAPEPAGPVEPVTEMTPAAEAAAPETPAVPLAFVQKEPQRFTTRFALAYAGPGVVFLEAHAGDDAEGRFRDRRPRRAALSPGRERRPARRRALGQARGDERHPEDRDQRGRRPSGAAEQH